MEDDEVEVHITQPTVKLERTTKGRSTPTIVKEENPRSTTPNKTSPSKGRDSPPMKGTGRGRGRRTKEDSPEEEQRPRKKVAMN